jgi:hypothetical protein
MGGVEPDPGRRQHEVDVPVVAVAPILEHLLQVELRDHIMCGEESVHVGFKAQFSVDGALVELDLHEAIRIGPDDEIDLRPVNHDHLLDVVYDVGQLLLGHPFHAAVCLGWLELTVKNFVLFNPLRSKYVFLADLVGVVQTEKRRHKLLERCVVKETVLELDYTNPLIQGK